MKTGTRAAEAPTGMMGVLDLETAPEARATRIAGGRQPMARGALHRVRAAALLVHGGGEARLSSWSEEDGPEDEMLVAMDTELVDLRRSGGTLATYNGTRHDLPVLARRTAAHWLFGADGLLGWSDRRWPHVDVMDAWTTRGSAPSSLRDLCAGLGIPTDPGAHGGAVAKAETDVVATALAHLHLLALDQRDLATLAGGWLAVSDLCEREMVRRPWLRQFARHERVATLKALRTAA